MTSPSLRGFKLGDEIQLTFRPLTDTYFGLIRDGVDSLNWRSYPTYQDTFKIVGLYNELRIIATFLPIFQPPVCGRALHPSTQNQFRYEGDYSFVLDTPRVTKPSSFKRIKFPSRRWAST